MSGAGPASFPERSRVFLHGLGGPEEQVDSRGVLMVVAHPDDETIALGAQLGRLQGIKLLHVTDGAPENMTDANSVGLSTREEYARARRVELEAAMALAGIDPGDLLSLGIIDQGAARQLPSIARRLADTFQEHGIHTVIAHAYEGGHPDHDASAFGTHAACGLLQAAGQNPPGILEVPLYRSKNGAFVMQDFAPADPNLPGIVLELNEEQLRAKRRMLDAHVTQRLLLANFNGAKEPVRVAPIYDFGDLPNGGDLHYETMDWALTGAEWLTLVDEACKELRLPRWL